MANLLSPATDTDVWLPVWQLVLRSTCQDLFAIAVNGVLSMCVNTVYCRGECFAYLCGLVVGKSSDELLSGAAIGGVECVSVGQ